MLEKHVVSLEMSNILQESKITAKSLYGWVVQFYDQKCYVRSTDGLLEHEYIPAYTISELLEMLPLVLKDRRPLSIEYRNGYWQVGYWDGYTFPQTCTINPRLPDALANLLIYVRQYGIV